MDWLALLPFLGRFFIRREPNMEPIVHGYALLAKRQDGYIERLENRQVIFEAALAESIRDRKRIRKSTGRKIGKLIAEVKLCNEDRDRLRQEADEDRKRIESLEQTRTKNGNANDPPEF